MKLENEAQRLLDQTGMLRQPSDLDLLLFFARHRRALLSTEQICAFLGYGLKDIASGLELLLEWGYLSRTPSPRNAARMYVFVLGSSDDGWLPALLRIASTRQGRLALVLALREKSEIGKPGGDRDPHGWGDSESGAGHMLNFRGRATSVEPSQNSSDASRQDREGAKG